MKKNTKKVLLNARTGKFTSKRYVKTYPEKSMAVSCKTGKRKKCR